MADQWPPAESGWPSTDGGVRRSGVRRAMRVVGAVTVLALVGAVAADLGKDSTPSYEGFGGTDLTPSPTAPSQSRDPSAGLLANLIVSDADVGPGQTVSGLPGGNGLRVPTLDLCNGTYASEAQRTARLQVAVVEGLSETVLSTEAVLYSSGAATAAAFTELKSTAAACPDTPVESPVGLPTVTTRFGPAPDGDWPQVPSVERLAFAFETTDENGEKSRSVAVYLRRGRALLGVYFSNADEPKAVVEGKTAFGDIVNIFAERLAKLPVAAISTTA
ncbi:MAG TPA: hypothetical protein VEG38_08370 [Acidimicrobiia bacterium]|nr:hypothetical protein [Acidimicrobiia bacterium]